MDINVFWKELVKPLVDGLEKESLPDTVAEYLNTQREWREQQLKKLPFLSWRQDGGPSNLADKLTGTDHAQSFVYLMVAPDGLWKIGISSDPYDRVQNVRSNKGKAIRICHLISAESAEAIEKMLHRRYASKRVFGEWFRLDSQDLAEIFFCDSAYDVTLLCASQHVPTGLKE